MVCHSPRFLVPGVGFGGSCFPKDVEALVRPSQDTGYDPPLLQAVLLQNETQYLRAIKLLEEALGDLKGGRIALLGLAFKGGDGRCAREPRDSHRPIAS